MDTEKAGKIGRAFALGYVYGHGVLMAQDEAKWITVHPNGTGANANGDPIKGRPLLIDDETGSILGGMGGKGKGKKLTDFKTSRKKMTFKSSGSASKPAKPHHNNPSLAGSGPFAAMARKFARENPEKFAEAQKQRGQPGKNPTIAAMRELNQLRHSAPSASIPPASAAQPQVSAPAPASASASSYKEAAERVKQIQERQKDIDRQIHSLVSTVDWNDSDTPEAKQALSQIAKLRSDYAKLNDDLGSAIKERAALEKTTDHPNFTHATIGRNESEITSGTWEREQARRYRNFMANTFGTSSSETPANATKKDTNGLKIKQPENSEISLPKPAVPANWREMSYGEQFAAKMDMQKQFLTPDLDYSKLSEKDLNTYERVAKEAANERDRYFGGKTVTTNADLAQKRLDQIQDYKTYRGSALKSQEAAADVRQYGKLWESSDGRVKRLYLKPYNLGLKAEKYKTGNIKNATVNGEPISNSKASGLLNMEAYINLKTGKLEGSDAREFSKYFGKDIDKIISDNFSVGDAS